MTDTPAKTEGKKPSTDAAFAAKQITLSIEACRRHLTVLKKAARGSEDDSLTYRIGTLSDAIDTAEQTAADVLASIK